jgi:hypothetical protein
LEDFWSPSGACEGTEYIGIVIIQPDHFRGEEFDPSAALRVDQLKEGSLSAVRLSWTCPREIGREIIGPLRAKKNIRSARGILSGLIEDVEAIMTNGNQAFQVRVHGTREIPGHVHVGFVPGNVKEPKLMRQELVQALLGMGLPNDIQQIETCCSWVRSRTSTHPVPSKHPTT